MRHCVKEVDSLFHPKVRWGEDSIFNAPAGVGGQLDVPRGRKGVYRLDQADGANADQVVHVSGLGVILFKRVMRGEVFSRT